MFLAFCLATSALAPSSTVVVTGANGRVGRLVVEALLARSLAVRAVVRDLDKAREALPPSENVELVQCDIATDVGGLDKIGQGAAAAIWCASGFNEAGEAIDVAGITRLAKALPAGADDDKRPKMVVCSSAGVTRPDWSEEKKEKLIGASDIPIIRLNPGGILGQKVAAEQNLRQSGVPYCIVRPTGLKDDWPTGRPILSQGDVAVGRTTPSDLARVLVDVLDEPAASGKTMEMFTMAGYPMGELTAALEGLAPDTSPPTEAAVEASYRLLQQMLPGEQQDATKLEMGRTYEQVDSGEVAARERGAAATAREEEVAAGALSSMGGRRRKRDVLKRLFDRVGA